MALLDMMEIRLDQLADTAARVAVRAEILEVHGHEICTVTGGWLSKLLLMGGGAHCVRSGPEASGACLPDPGKVPPGQGEGAAGEGRQGGKIPPG